MAQALRPAIARLKPGATMICVSWRASRQGVAASTDGSLISAVPLRELVECWGHTMQYPDRADIKVFYHGISSSMLFDSTSIRLCGPVSTTLGMLLACFLALFLLAFLLAFADFPLLCLLAFFSQTCFSMMVSDIHMVGYGF